MKEQYVELLRGIGLTDSEIKVYLALLELGESSKGPIVEKSGVASSKIYELLGKLTEKGLVSTVIKSGVKYYESAPASRILDYMRDKEKKLVEQEEELKKIIPYLESRRLVEMVGTEVQVFKGMKGAETAFNDILKELKKGEEYTVMGISKFTPHFKLFIEKFHKKRASEGIKCKIIVNELAKDIGKELKKNKLTKVRYLRKELFTPVVFIIYNNKTLISIGLDEVFITIKSKNLTEGMKAYAEYLWEIAKE